MARKPKTPTTVDTLMLRLGLGPTEIAKRAGITRATLHSYRTGARKPRIAQLVRLARVLGVTPEELAGVIGHG